MKKIIIEFFQNLPEAKHDQFNKAFDLYRKSEGKNPVAERNYNVQGYTPSSLENLLYDLQKLHGITDVEKSIQLAVVSVQVEELSEQVTDLETEKENLEFENLDLQSENEDLKKEVEILKLAPIVDAKSIRVEFPFLNDKECPDEFKILVADKITAWNKYLHCHDLLSRIESGDLVFTDDEKVFIAKEAVESFDENKKIYDELNCYQTTGKVLGVHPIFKKLQLTREVEAMTADELIKYRGSSAKFASVKKTALAKAKKAKDEAKVQEIENAVAERSEKLFLVNKKLGV